MEGVYKKNCKWKGSGGPASHTRTFLDLVPPWVPITGYNYQGKQSRLSVRDQVLLFQAYFWHGRQCVSQDLETGGLFLASSMTATCNGTIFIQSGGEN